MSIKYVLQKNNLVEEPNIFSASVRTTNSVGLSEITDRIVEQGTTVRRADVLAVLENALTACDSMLLDGMRIQLGGLVDLFPKIKGSFEGPTDIYDPSRHQVDVAATPGIRVRNTFRSQARVVKEEAIKPVPGLVAFDQIPAPAGMSADITSTPLVPNAIGTINGHRLRFDPTKADEGIFLVPVAGGTATKVTNVQKNMPKQLVFQVPSVPSSTTWYLEVRTRYTPEGELRIGRLDGTFGV